MNQSGTDPGFVAGIIFGWVLILAIPLLIGIVHAIRDPYRFLVDLGWFLVPSDWVWMGFGYRRRKWYEFLRSEHIRLDIKEREDGWKRIKAIEQRYP